MSKIQLRSIKQKVVSTVTQPLYIGGVLEDNSDAKITIGTDGKVSGLTTVYTATIPSASWTGSSAPYTKAVAKEGILPTDKPILDLVFIGTYATDVTMRTNWSVIYRGVTSTDTITFYADSVPTADINIQLVVVR
jgi:hypothetical protein